MTLNYVGRSHDEAGRAAQALFALSMEALP
jgi:hypothetical protein